MKNTIRSARLQAILDFAEEKSVRMMIHSKKRISRRVLKEIQHTYRDIFILCGEMMEKANNVQETIVILPEDSRWEKAGLLDLCEDEYILVRRMCSKDGHPVALTRDGLFVPPRSEKIKPVVELAEAS